MKILIRVKRITEYASTVEMSLEDYNSLRCDLDNGGRVMKLAEKRLNKMIDVHDWQDDELHSLEEFGPA